MDISNLRAISLANSPLKKLSVEPNIISSTNSWNMKISLLTFLVKGVRSVRPLSTQGLPKII
jgi:hypothetical protein